MAKRKQGVFLTLDVVVAMLLIFSIILMSFSLFTAPSKYDSNAQIVDIYMQDASSVISSKGYLESPFYSANNSDTSGISEVLRATPDSVCMQVTAYCSEVPQGLMAYWKLDDDFGTSVADASGNGHTGAMVGSPQPADGKSGRAMHFNGSNYVDTGFDSSWGASNSVSWSFWVNPDATSGNEGMLGKGYPNWEWSFYRSGNTASLVYWNTGGGHTNGMDVSWGSVLQAGQWTHLVYTWDGITSRLYSNGVLVNSRAAVDPTINQDRANSVLIGGHIYVWADAYFHGAIDEVRVYDRALSADEVKKLYSNPTNVAYSVGKQECPYSGGQVRALTIPVLRNIDQNENNYCYAIMKAWPRGART